MTGLRLVAAHVGDSTNEAGTAGEVKGRLHPIELQADINCRRSRHKRVIASLRSAENSRARLNSDIVVLRRDKRRISRAVIDKRVADSGGTRAVVDVRDRIAIRRPIVDDNTIRHAAAVDDKACSISPFL